MANLNKKEISALRAIMREPGWDILFKLSVQLINEYNEKTVSGTNAFETLRSLHTKQGMVAGITELFEIADRGVSDE